MLKIGITGGIGSGKSTVAKIFEVLDIPVYYADLRAKQLMTGHKKVKSSIINLLGKQAYFRNGRLNRKWIGSKVFQDKALLQQLNSIVHPAVADDYNAWTEQHREAKYTLKEAALLIESKSYQTLDLLILVTAKEEIRIQRVMKRDNTSYEAVKNRIHNQISEEEKLKYAHLTIDNSGKESLILQVLKIHSFLQKYPEQK